MLTVPAHAWLWSDFDVKAQHCRRYAKGELRSKLMDAGFIVTRLSSFIASTLPLLWLHRRLYKSRRETFSQTGGNDIVGAELRIVPVVNAFLRIILYTEVQLLSRGVELPQGSSFVAIARRTA
jgi:hypothetical protein